MIKIAIDAMGGDNAPIEIVKGCDLALDAYPDIELVLFGDEPSIKSLLKNQERVTIVHTTEIISMGEKDPVKAIRNNRDSSMVKALYSAKNGETSAVVSAGPTQALIVGAHLVIKRMEKMHRVALAPIIPSVDQKGRILLDVGANIELRPEHMLELALYATVVSREYLGVEKPTVALMNIGTEEGKGRDLEKETFKLLKENPQINFLGNIEGKEILTTEANIVLTDGYTGNVLMKTMEGTAKGMGNMLKEEIKSSFMGKIGYLFMKKNLKRFQKRMDASEIGGAMIFGIKAPVIKAHGSSNAHAFMNAIRQARQFVSNQVVEKVEVALKDIIIEESSDSN
ncbi:phosphate acyltransferase PlsX [Paracholeplasma manati]|uniref:phosphate acyltransferase PlsX n=1 Tax=Paracholeplasma manati TaxID=591373 RepID=UPI002407C1C7|nr:phosphate acyltransferase PlsX [Paracholeplasma manati]MDG0888535.1 phosphate acyltransferase PlsX [Paracholeplasma manati]